jgi:siroheme synthase
VLGRVGEEALRLAELDVPFEIIPGVSSATAVPELAGIPVTHRGLADSFVVATAHRRRGEIGLSIPQYSENTTLVLLMARATAPAWRNALVAGGYPPELPVALVSAGCTRRQRVVISSVAEALRDLRAADLETPLLAVVGWVVTLHGRLGAAQPDTAGTRSDSRAAGAMRSGLRIALRTEFESDEAAPPVWSAAVAP